MKDYRVNNKRIAKNSLVIYANLLLRMLLGLYTSRIALEALGVSDYGLFYVVGGVVTLFGFIFDSLSSTTYRFINFEQGKENGDVNKIFNACHVMHLLMAIVIFLLLETFGLYYIDNCLNVAVGKENDAFFVFQVAVIFCCIGIANVPFSGLLYAVENFKLNAVVNISVKIVQLLLLFWLLSYDGNRIRVFALIIALTKMACFITYHIYCHNHWPDIVKWRFSKDWGLYKKIGSFSTYNLLSFISSMGRNQGSNLLINIFFGTSINGAFSLAKTIERNLLPFSNNLLSATAPQIIQNYSSGDMRRVYNLTSRAGKYVMLVMLIAFFSLWIELDFVLRIWLGYVPPNTLEFCRFILLLVFIGVTDAGLSHVINASGKVARFTTVYCMINVLCILMGFLLLNAGSPAYMLLLIFLVADSVWRVIQFIMVRQILDFPIKQFIRDVYYPVLKVILCMLLFIGVLSLLNIECGLWHVCRIFLIFIAAVLFVFFVGLKNTERKQALIYFRDRFL